MNSMTQDEWNNFEDDEQVKMTPTRQRTERGRAICEEALRTINGERQGQYGDPEDTFKKIADLWSSYLFSGSGRVEWLTPMQVADMMCLLKIAREAGGKGKRDNMVDLIGYAALAANMRGYDA